MQSGDVLTLAVREIRGPGCCEDGMDTALLNRDTCVSHYVTSHRCHKTNECHLYLFISSSKSWLQRSRESCSCLRDEVA